jgi:hypothetical protein
MRRYLFIAILCLIPIYAISQQKMARTSAIGWGGVNLYAAATTYTNNAGDEFAYCFYSNVTRTVSEMLVNLPTVSGTQADRSARAYVYDTSAGSPNAVITSGTSNTVTNFAAGWQTFTWDVGSRPTVSGMTKYCAVIKNTAVDPATQGFGLMNSSLSNILPIAYNSGSATATISEWSKHFKDDGGAWSAAIADFTTIRIGYSDGTYDGFPLESSALSTAVISWGTNTMGGIALTIPGNQKFNVIGVRIPTAKIGSPTAPHYILLYENTTLVGTSSGFVSSTLSSAGAIAYAYFFPSAITMTGGNTYRIVMSCPACANASNAVRMHEYTMQNSAASYGLVPFLAKTTVTNDGGASFTETNNVWTPYLLLLDTSGEFSTTSGGGGGISAW